VNRLPNVKYMDAKGLPVALGLEVTRPVRWSTKGWSGTSTADGAVGKA
jgi:hypothetical protein